MKGIDVFSTKKISSSLVEYWAKKGMQITSKNFIEVMPLSYVFTGLGKEMALIFSSLNAVNYFDLTAIDEKTKVYSVGNKTSQKLRDAGFIHLTQGRNAEDLLLQIKNDPNPPEEYMFICGDLRLSTLPIGLSDQGKKLEEVWVYQTQVTPQKEEKVYQAYLFYSPSGVKSFFLNNELPKGAIAFAIGQTTQRIIEEVKNTKAEVQVAKTATIEGLLDAVEKHYSS